MGFGLKRNAALGVLLACMLGEAAAQGIYTCVDKRGRRLTSDRPIPECMDREQKELNASGTVRRTHGPALTAKERAAEEEKVKQAALEKQRAAEDDRRDRALVARYRDQAAHDRERALALENNERVLADARKRVEDLQKQQSSLKAEASSHNNDPARMPAGLKRRLEENEQQLGVQKRMLANQEEEKQRVEARFDEELARLKVLWSGRTASPKAARR